MTPKLPIPTPDLLDACIEILDNLDHLLQGPENLLIDDRALLLRVREEIALVCDGETPTDFLPLAISLGTRLLYRPSLSAESLPTDVSFDEEDHSWESLSDLCLRSRVIGEGDPRIARILHNLTYRILPQNAFELVTVIALKGVDRRLRGESEQESRKMIKALKA